MRRRGTGGSYNDATGPGQKRRLLGVGKGLFEEVDGSCVGRIVLSEDGHRRHSIISGKGRVGASLEE